MTARLIEIGTHFWDEISGYVTAHGGGALGDLPVDRFCSLVWWWITRNAETETDIEKIREQIWMPPKGEKGEGVWSAESETDSLHGLMADLGVDE